MENVVMYEKGLPGGQIMNSSEIENYPGVSGEITGMELMECWPEQCMKFGLKHEMEEVVKIKRECNKLFTLELLSGKSVQAKAVIVCTGSTPKRAGFEGEEEFFGKGVSTCATCDGFFYKDKEVAVLGGGDIALEEAIYLSNICSKVYLIHRRDTFRAAPATVERAKENQKIEFILNATIKKAYGDMMGLQGLLIEQDEKEIDLKVPGVFVFVGRDVLTNPLKQQNGSYLCELNDKGEIIVNLKMQTSLEGLYAAGDIRVDAPKQVVCAAGDGAVAALQAIARSL